MGWGGWKMLPLSDTPEEGNSVPFLEGYEGMGAARSALCTWCMAADGVTGPNVSRATAHSSTLLWVSN